MESNIIIIIITYYNILFLGTPLRQVGGQLKYMFLFLNILPIDTFTMCYQRLTPVIISPFFYPFVSFILFHLFLPFF